MASNWLGLRREYEKVLLFGIFAVFLILRLFSLTPYFFIQGGDDARYLALAQSFPSHLLDNNQFYITHPPLFSWIVAVFSFVFEDYIAGILVSLLSSIASFFLIYAIFKKVASSVYVALTVVLLYSISPFFISIATLVSKESLALMLFLLTIHYFISFVEERSAKAGLIASVFGALHAMTTDHTLLLIPALVLTAFFFSRKKVSWGVLIPIFVTVVFYLIWIGIRVYVYTHYEYYPAAMDGTPVSTEGWGVRELLSPHYFDEKYVPFGIVFELTHYLYPIFYMLNVQFFPWPHSLTFQTIGTLFSLKLLPQLLIYAGLVGTAIIGIVAIFNDAVKSGFKRNALLWMLVMFAIFFAPAAQILTSTRYVQIANIFLYGIIGLGIVSFFRAVKQEKRLRLHFAAAVGMCLILLIPYVIHNHYFMLTKEKIVELRKTAPFIQGLPKDGIMAQFGYSPELNYLTTKRVMTLPESVEDLSPIDLFNISYVLYGEYYLDTFETGKMFNYDIIDYIRKHPERFKLLAVVEERYEPRERPDHIYIYEVVRKD